MVGCRCGPKWSQCCANWVAPVMATRLDEQLRALTGPDRAITLANLASSFGYDVRIMAAYDAALDDTDAASRQMAVRGLAMLGELSPVLAASGDPDPSVRWVCGRWLRRGR